MSSNEELDALLRQAQKMRRRVCGHAMEPGDPVVTAPTDATADDYRAMCCIIEELVLAVQDLQQLVGEEEGRSRARATRRRQLEAIERNGPVY
jgi:hypothetical protein